jgi:sRNA-binding carbon storage regulator CsrA
MAVDAADGVKADNSVFEVIDNMTMEQVAEFYSDNIPPHLFCYIINEIAIYYNTCQVVIEAMAPAGGAVLAGLKDKLMYENLYYDTEKRMFPGIKTDRQIRPMVLESLQHTLMQGEKGLKVNSPRFVHELKTFKYNASKKRAEADKGKHDDAVMAMSIAIYVRNEAMKGIPVGADVPKELTDVFRSEVYEKVRQEIKDGLPENWIEDDEDFFDVYQGEVTPGVVFNVKRKFDKLLKEFDW